MRQHGPLNLVKQCMKVAKGPFSKVCPNTKAIHTCYRNWVYPCGMSFASLGVGKYMMSSFPTIASLWTRSSPTLWGYYSRGGKVHLREMNAPNRSSGWKPLLRITLIIRPRRIIFYLLEGEGNARRFFFFQSFYHIRLEVFLVAIEMAKGKKDSLVIPYLVLPYKALREFHAIPQMWKGRIGLDI